MQKLYQCAGFNIPPNIPQRFKCDSVPGQTPVVYQSPIVGDTISAHVDLQILTIDLQMPHIIQLGAKAHAYAIMVSQVFRRAWLTISGNIVR